MWSEIKIHLPDAAVAEHFPASRGGTHADMARNITARLNEQAGFPLPNAFFHYDEEGRPMNSRPHVRFGSFTRGISVIGVGASGVEMVESLGHKFRRLWADELRAALPESRYSGQNRIRFSGRPCNYYIHALAFEKRESEWTFRKDDWFDACKDEMAQAILRGLKNEVATLHQDDPQVCDEELLEALESRLQADITRARSLGMRRLSSDPSIKATIPLAKGVEFVLPLAIEGVWHVGRLSSRGFGMIREVRGNSTMERSHAVRS